MHCALQNNEALIQKIKGKVSECIPAVSFKVVCSLGLVLELRSWEEHESRSLLSVL